ncbi:LysR family transcriptional regulator [Paenibacillus sp. J2TS4]|uniref:LysR family transcriptional regulator n=1 Tax=Paenibacillus sp. J2TS4 TaxID=2807194 RepID=UPI001B264860|nr:LysR family transcriptional regulator [Paenibacillus sp. J2TS4]GIP34806.1 HTH-type transcriptional regulator CzcR [Paenibacillus sp. J2TS4]
MEISDLVIFQSVAKEGSVSGAARQLNYVQSNVTARIKQLEKELRTSLFYRHSRGMTLTPEGKKLLEYSDKIIFTMKEMQSAFQDPDQPAGNVEIGTVETVIRLPQILSVYYHRYPNVDLSLVTGVTEELVQDVIHHRLDGAFVTGPVIHPQIVQHEAFDENLVLVTHKSASDPHDELRNKPLLVFGAGCGYRAKLEHWLQGEGISPVKKIEFGTLETILGSVAAGLGITLVPELTAATLQELGKVNTFTVPREIGQIKTVFIRSTDSYLTNSIQKFIEVIEASSEEDTLL